MKFILYLVFGFTLMYGSYFFYTLYSKSHQSNTNIFEDNISLNTDKKQNIEFDDKIWLKTKDIRIKHSKKLKLNHLKEY